jgi:putative membrane protein
MYYGYRGLWMMPMMLLCIVFIVLAVVILIKYSNIINPKCASNRAIHTLNDKLASGEISEEEYKRKKQMINEK